MSTPNRSSSYLLLLRQPAGGVPPPEELAKIMAKFNRWMARISDRRMLEGTNGLDITGKVLRRGRRGAKVTDGPYAETKEIVGGYVLIAAKSLAEAVKVAKACPGLEYNMTVEVRPVLTTRARQAR